MAGKQSNGQTSKQGLVEAEQVHSEAVLPVLSCDHDDCAAQDVTIAEQAHACPASKVYLRAT